jgi:hypothetical protein
MSYQGSSRRRARQGTAACNCVCATAFHKSWDAATQYCHGKHYPPGSWLGLMGRMLWKWRCAHAVRHANGLQVAVMAVALGAAAAEGARGRRAAAGWGRGL